LNIT